MYFHYTSGSGAKAIRQCGYIQPSEESGFFGPGVYLTDLDPNDFFRDEILRNNYGGIASSFRNRADWVVRVFEKNMNMQLLRKVDVPGRDDRRIYVYPNSITISTNQIYDKPRCFKNCNVWSSDSSDEDDCYNDSTNHYGSDEFDTQGVLCDSDGSDYGDVAEEFEDSDEPQTDETGSYASEDEGNDHSEYDLNEFERTSDEEESYEDTSGDEGSQCNCEEGEEYGSDDGSGEDECHGGSDGDDCDEDECDGGSDEDDCDGDDCDGDDCDGDDCDGDDCDGDDCDGDSDGDDCYGDDCDPCASDDYSNGYSDYCYDESDDNSY